MGSGLSRLERWGYQSLGSITELILTIQHRSANEEGHRCGLMDCVPEAGYSRGEGSLEGILQH